MKKILYSVLITFATLSFAQDSPQWHLPDGAKMRLGKGRAGEIAYSPDGTKLAVASGIGIWIYDAETGEELDLFPANRFEVRNIAFSPDGSMLASDSFDNTINYWSIENRTVRLWDVKSRRQIRTFTGHRYPISHIAFSPDGKTIAGSADNDVHVWDVESGRQLHRLWGIGTSVTSVVFSPDSKILATSGYLRKNFYLWDVETGGLMRRFEGHTESISSLAFHPDGELIASGSYDNTVRLWNVDTGVEERSFTRHTESVFAVAFSPDGNTLASGSWDNTIRLWHVLDGTSRDVLTGHTSSIRTVVFGPDSNTLASRSWNGTIRLWNDYGGMNDRVGWRQRIITGHIDHGGNIEFSPDGNTLVSNSSNKVLQLWDVNTGRKQHDFVGHTGNIDSVAFSPDGKTIASGSEDGTLRLWDADTGMEQRTLIEVEGYVESVAFSPDGKKIACLLTTGNFDYSVHFRNSDIALFDVETGSELLKIAAYKAPPPPVSRHYKGVHPTEHTEPVIKIAFSPHGNIIASSSYDKTIRLWHVQTGEHLRVFAKQVNWAYNMTFSPDGNMLAYDSRDGSIHLWNVQNNSLLFTIMGEWDDLSSVVFSADGSMLASLAEDGTILLFDVQSGMEMRTFPGHKRGTFDIAFSPDGSTLASGSGDGTILLWDLNAPLPSNTIVSLSPVSVESPVVGQQLTLSIDIGYGQNVAGYQATVHFDTTALRYVESGKGDYLPASAYVMPPVVEGDRVMLAATSYAEESNVDGTLATITFEVIATKPSTVSLSDVLLTDIAGNSTKPKIIAATEITEPMFLPEDVNEDGVVNVLDLVSIAANFGKTGKNDADINRDGVVNIVDLTLVAAAIGNADSAAPGIWHNNIFVGAISESRPYHPEYAMPTRATFVGAISESRPYHHLGYVMPTRATVAAWLKEARQLNLTDPAFQRGILVLENLLQAFTPKETALLPNYPNPFNPETWIPYQLATPADVHISIYAADGKLVRQLDLGHQPVGMYQHRSRAAYWDGTNALGESVASGVYFYTLSAGQFSATRKMLIRK